MNKMSRIYQLRRLFSARRRPVPLRVIGQEMACSESTARRLVHELRDEMNAPLVYDRTYHGWRYEGRPDERDELPGLWFTPDELYALMVSWQLLSELQPGWVRRYVEPARDKIEAILSHQDGAGGDISRRVRILPLAARPTDLRLFQRLSGALFERRRVRVVYHGRERDESTERELSPQRLIYYRSNWYLDAWCHLRNGLRSFSLDRLQMLGSPGGSARECSGQQLDAHFTRAYGIFAGKPKHTAVLRFTPHAARWVADEHWHPAQQEKVLKSGEFELRIPYGDPRELIMDILKYGPDVEVLRPQTLRAAVAERLRAAAGRYRER